MRGTIRPLLLSLLKGAKKTDSRDELKIKLIKQLSAKELQQIDDMIVAFLRVELDKIIIDKLIAERYEGMSGNTQTATDGS